MYKQNEEVSATFNELVTCVQGKNNQVPRKDFNSFHLPTSDTKFFSPNFNEDLVLGDTSAVSYHCRSNGELICLNIYS